MSIVVRLDVNGLTYIIENFNSMMSQVMLAVATVYLDRVLGQFDNNPSYWKELDVRTVMFKKGLQRFGEPVKFKQPEQILTNYGILRDSTTLRPNKSRIRRTPTGTPVPFGYNVGYFVGQTPSDRLRWAWVHEFGSSHFINQWKPRTKALGKFRALIFKKITHFLHGMKPLSISKADIQGKLDFEKFYTASLRMFVKWSKRISRTKGKANWVHIPRRSILKQVLMLFANEFRNISNQALTAFFNIPRPAIFVSPTPTP